jgi:hypothetical protein
MSQHEPYHTVVAGLECLTDVEWCAIVARAQSFLLDRPGVTGGTPLLTVEVVTWDEAWLLAR